ncbi:nucleoplasmin-like [Ambystoma mexicanum]|uniref:nucleoplasmin-like n=1 Tax=Ambystoma mexicanum TaxID=8296 RepID=UPI0037E7E38C
MWLATPLPALSVAVVFSRGEEAQAPEEESAAPLHMEHLAATEESAAPLHMEAPEEAQAAASEAPPRTNSFLFGCGLSAITRKVSFPGGGDDLREQLTLRTVSLGLGAPDVLHVLEVLGETQEGTIRVPVATLRPSLLTSVYLGGLELTPPVTFWLTAGTGPLYISGQHLVAITESEAAAKALVEREAAAAKASAERLAAAKAPVEREAAASKAAAKREAAAKRKAAFKASAKRKAASKSSAERLAAAKAPVEREAAASKAAAKREAAAKRKAAFKALAKREAAASKA